MAEVTVTKSVKFNSRGYKPGKESMYCPKCGQNYVKKVNSQVKQPTKFVVRCAFCAYAASQEQYEKDLKLQEA